MEEEYLRLCCGKPGVELVRKPGLGVCMGGQFRESPGDLWGHWSHCWEGAWILSGKVSGDGSVTARETREWSDWEVSLTLWDREDCTHPSRINTLLSH